MALVTLRQLLDHAAEYGYGVPAFNINNMEQMLAVMNAARRTDSPVILQASRGARQYAGDIVLRHLVQAATEIHPDIPVCMHLDHGNSPAACLSAAVGGFTSVMMDGSLEADCKTPASYAYNVEVTARVAAAAHMVGVSVEGELGCLGSLETGEGEAEDGHGFSGALSRESLLTDPDQAADFVARTGVDALAVAIGTSHGAYKFSRPPQGDILAMDVIKAIHARLPTAHLVMHGASAVPQELQDLFNAHGGAMPQTWGVPTDEIVAGIRCGVRKINIDTDARLAMTGQFRRVLAENPREFDPRQCLKPAMQAMQAMCEARFTAFGAAGHAAKLKPLPLDAMALRYARGELTPQIPLSAAA